MGEAKQYRIDVRALRKRSKLRLRQVAEALGISSPALSDWENGLLDLKFRVDQIDKLLEIYNISYSELSNAWSETERQPTRRESKERAEEREATQTR